jgi:uncharacterized protein YjdB
MKIGKKLLSSLLAGVLSVSTFTVYADSEIGGGTELEEAKQALSDFETKYATEIARLDTGIVGYYNSIGATTASEVIAQATSSDEENYSWFGSLTTIGGEKDATSLDYVKKTIDYIKECNSLRESESVSDLQVSMVLMAYAELNANYATKNNTHAQIYMGSGENLAWGYSGAAGSKYSPFRGWYDEEKELYDNGTDSFSEVGHYLNIKNDSYVYTGYAVAGNTGGIACQEFGRNITSSTASNIKYGRDGDVTMSVDDFETSLTNYINSQNSIKSKYEELKKAAKEHNWDSGTVTKEATCTEKGIMTYTCTDEDCTATKTEDIDALGHEYSEDWTTDKKATCAEEGSKSHHCVRCGEKADITVIEKTEDHQWDDGQTIEMATYTKDGSKLYTCKVCGKTETRSYSLTESTESVTYKTHVQDYGWQDWKKDGELSGTSGESKRLEAINIEVVNQSVKGSIKYRTHIQDIGWQDWKTDGELSGTEGLSKRLEAIQIKLTGELAESYDVYYRVHAQDYGWLDWAKNGESAGTEGLSKRLEAIEIVLVKKGEDAPGNTDKPFVCKMISYSTHVQDTGWQSYVSDGELSGTSGQSERLEAIKVKLSSSISGSVEYKTHVQDIGWQDWKSNDEMSGTSGQSKRLEAIQIKLTGEAEEKYDIYYRVHCEDYGWLGWAKNGQSAGSEGYSKRLEGIEIVLVKKGESAPGSTKNRFIKKATYTISDGNEEVTSYVKNGKYYFFLKNTFDLTNATISSNLDIEEANAGTVTDGNVIGDLSNISSISITQSNGCTNSIEIIQSEVPSLNITLNDGKTLSDVNNGSKNTKYSSTLTVSGSDNGSYDLSDISTEFKGRGNTSWTYSKKGYQIKLDKKQNLLGIGNGKSKKWVLLANYQDPTLIKNKFMYDLCVNSGLSNIPNSTYVDLYVNGEYVGNYLLCDKVETGSSRINLNNDDGVLVELDNAYYASEDYYFQSSVSGNYYVVKEFGNDDMDDASKRAAMNSFKSSIENLESKLNYTVSWSEISSLIDADSFAKYYLVNEFAENMDTYYSSTYFYMDGSNDVIHMGPIWDYDKDNFTAFSSSGNLTLERSGLIYDFMKKFYIYPQFSQKVDDFYNSTLKSVLSNMSISDYASQITNSSRINSIVWNSENKNKTQLSDLNNWVEKRKKYFAKRYANGSNNVYYSTHIEDRGWVTASKSGQTSGTSGQSKRMEAIRIYGVDENGKSLSLKYKTHVQDVGWQDWVSNGHTSGLVGQSKRLEAIQIQLTGEDAEKYDIYYRVHAEDYGWLGWAKNGQSAGTEGLSKRLEAIEIVLVEKGGSAPGSTSNPFIK